MESSFLTPTILLKWFLQRLANNELIIKSMILILEEQSEAYDIVEYAIFINSMTTLNHILYYLILRSFISLFKVL